MTGFAFVRRWQIVIAGVAVGAVMTAAEIAAGLPPDRSVSTFVIVAGFSLVVATLQGRSETASLLAGNPADERGQLINERAASFTALVGVVVSLGGYVVTEVAGRDSLGFAVVAASMGLAYIGGVAWYRARL